MASKKLKNVYIPENVHELLKVEAAKRKTSMQQLVCDMVMLYTGNSDSKEANS